MSRPDRPRTLPVPYPLSSVRRRSGGPARRLTGLAVVTAGAALVWAPGAPASAAPTGVPEAVDYVVSQLVDGDHVESSGFVQYGQTVDVALGLAATGDASWPA